MKYSHDRNADRGGFTLIELLVVIAIIAILVSLTTAAVMKFMSLGPVAQDRTDVNTLDQALKNFYAKHKFYPPSRIFLANTRAKYNNNNAFHMESLQYLSRMFPQNAWTGINWSNGVAMPAAGVTLQGDQCLVFFLGGIPTKSGTTFGCLGFSSNPQNPTALPTAGEQREKYYEFKSNRLVQFHGATNPFYSYNNPYDLPKPYAYFAIMDSPTAGSAYNSTYPTGLGNSDCNLTATTLGVSPYAETWAAPAPRFLNPNSFQIISAGADGKFGAGTTSTATVWTPANVGANSTGAGKDDISNFSGQILGASQ